MARSFDCVAKEKAARLAGQSYVCTCGLMPCDEGGPPHEKRSTSAKSEP